MKKQKKNNLHSAKSRHGIALAITLMVLVVLSVITAALAVRVNQVRQRQQYIMDYQKARYGLDSAMKYAMTVLPERKFSLVDRKNAPDFSDLFWLNRDDYFRYINAWAGSMEPEQIMPYLKKTDEQDEGVLKKKDSQSVFGQLLSKYLDQDPLNTEPNDTNSMDQFMEYFDPNEVVVPGPWGPAWPNVIEPVTLEIGECRVTIAIEDENAKMPLSWLVTDNINTNKQARVALQTFAEWMAISDETADALVFQLQQLSKHKMFKLNYSTVLLPAQKAEPAKPASQPQTTARAGSRRRALQRTTQAQQQTQPQQKNRAEVAHAADFAKLFHSSLLDIEQLAVPLQEMAFENESALKYMALWGSQRINVNTAPRQVLQAAFTFGGSPDEIADEVILARKQKPIKNIAQLKSELPKYSSAIDRAAPYIDTESKFFSVRVTSRCGRAKVSSVAAVIKEGKQMERLMMLYGR